jgi:hypothetical protein
VTLRRIATVSALLALVLPAVAAAQGLGDAAARERARRQAAKKAGETKQFTNEDLEQGRPPGTAPTGGEASAPSSSSSPPTSTTSEGGEESPDPSSEEADRREAEQPYQEGLRAAQSRLAQVEARIQELRNKLNPMSGSFIYGATGSNSANEEAQVRQELNQAEAELNAARQAVAEATRALQESRQGRPSAPPLVH